MIDSIDTSLINWSRAQFALTAMYHWLFVPLTLGLSFIVAIMESLYVKTGNEEWKRITKFWMILFGINFAIGIATGLILEFQFGTNWSAYSWFVGDIFGAPLAIEGIFAFFLESTFVAVMFFGWNKVSKRFHLVSTWLVAVGASLSALWILVANAWMQNPVGMTFNPDSARNEMTDFFAVLFNPVAADKFLHTVTSGFLLASVFVMGVSAWYLIKNRETMLAQKSILVAGIFGLISSLMVAFSGDTSARTIAKVQPMKFAAFEGLYEGKSDAGLVALGVMRDSGKKIGEKEVMEFAFRIEIPGFLSVMTGGDREYFVPGINDLVYKMPAGSGELSVQQKMERGKEAQIALSAFKEAKKSDNKLQTDSLRKLFTDKNFLNDNFKYFGYAFLSSPEEAVPDVAISFYSFHIMVMLGFLFIIMCAGAIYLVMSNQIIRFRWFLWMLIACVPLVYIASQSGWVLAEMGRQPWIIQNLMPVSVGATNVGTGAVVTTFILFAILFTGLLIAEVSIMTKQIKSGPKH